MYYDIRKFKESFESLGYTFPSGDVLEDVYTFYKYYENPINKGVSTILLEGDPGSGKTFLSEVFSSFLGQDGDSTEYIYTQCVEETNSDRLISTYNVSAIVKGDGDKAIAEGILARAINLANNSTKVVLTVDELDKARDALDSYFLNFIQSGKIETSDNQILSLTNSGMKNLYFVIAKNNERNLIDALLRRCTVIELPPMPPVLAYKTLVKKFADYLHDPKFLKFISKVYESIYNEQMASNGELLTRLPALQELILAVSSDNILYMSGENSTRRIKKLIRNLGKDVETRDIITDILTKKFKYDNSESNYTNETLDLDMDSPEDYMSTRDSASLVEQYMEKKDNGEYIFEEDEYDDPMKNIATILDNMKDDQSLVFLDKEDKEKIVELGVITHNNPAALDELFAKIKFKGNPNSRFGFLDFDDNNFVGLMKYKNTLILVANKEYVSPKLLMQGLASIVSIISDYNKNDFSKDITKTNLFFSETSAADFKLTGLNIKILSNSPNFVLNKMNSLNGVMVYQDNNMKITHDDTMNINYFRYLQKYRAEPFYDVVLKICKFNPELAIPLSFIDAKKFSTLTDRNLVKRYSDFVHVKEDLEAKRVDGWEVKIDKFETMDLEFSTLQEVGLNWYNEPKHEVVEEKDTFVFDYDIDINYEDKKIHMLPKYKLNGDYLLYTKDSDFKNNEIIKHLNSTQKEVAMLARDIFGNFVPKPSEEKSQIYFSGSSIRFAGELVDVDLNSTNVPAIKNNITREPDFIKYYKQLSRPTASMISEKILRKTR